MLETIGDVFLTILKWIGYGVFLLVGLFVAWLIVKFLELFFEGKL